MLEVVQVGIPALVAADKWRASMEKVEGEDLVIDTTFNCSRTADEKIAHQTFRDVKISAIAIGYDVEELWALTIHSRLSRFASRPNSDV